MRFSILSIKENSVRVKTGIITFDVKVIDENVIVPPNIFIHDKRDYHNMKGAVLAEYNKSKENNS